MHKSLFYTLAAALIPIGVTSAAGYARASTDGKALSMIEIVLRLEHNGYGPFTELSMDDGHWEAEVRKQVESLELTVDPISGKVLSHHRDDAKRTPPADAMPLSALLQSISESGSYKQFNEVSFEHRNWDVEAYKDVQKPELHVDPMNAKVIADRIDN